MRNSPLRELARNDFYQAMYRESKERNIKLFSNPENLSRIQIIFLSYLAFYESLYQDLAMDEDYISKEVILDDVRCDAYLVYKKRKRNKKDEKERPKNNTGIPSISFVPGKRGKKWL